MPRRCQITGKGPQFGNNVSHSHRKTRKKWSPNLIQKRVYLEEEKKWVKVRISSKVLKTISRKKSLSKLARERGIKL